MRSASATTTRCREVARILGATHTGVYHKRFFVDILSHLLSASAMFVCSGVVSLWLTVAGCGIDKFTAAWQVVSEQHRNHIM